MLVLVYVFDLMKLILTYLDFRPPFWRRLFYITSHGTAQFYSVATFTGKNHKLIHNDMKGVSARACSTNYFQRLTLICNNLLLTDVNPGGGGGGGGRKFHMKQTGMFVVLLTGVNFWISVSLRVFRAKRQYFMYACIGI